MYIYVNRARGQASRLEPVVLEIEAQTSHIYIHMYIHVCIYTHIYVHIYVYVSIYIYTYKCKYINIHVSYYIHIYIYTYMKICIYVHICIYIYIDSARGQASRLEPVVLEIEAQTSPVLVVAHLEPLMAIHAYFTGRSVTDKTVKTR